MLREERGPPQCGVRRKFGRGWKHVYNLSRLITGRGKEMGTSKDGHILRVLLAVLLSAAADSFVGYSQCHTRKFWQQCAVDQVCGPLRTCLRTGLRSSPSEHGPAGRRELISAALWSILCPLARAEDARPVVLVAGMIDPREML